MHPLYHQPDYVNTNLFNVFFYLTKTNNLIYNSNLQNQIKKNLRNNKFKVTLHIANIICLQNKATKISGGKNDQLPDVQCYPFSPRLKWSYELRTFFTSPNFSYRKPDNLISMIITLSPLIHIESKGAMGVGLLQSEERCKLNKKILDQN